jgi:hypothetical protein
MRVMQLRVAVGHMLSMGWYRLQLAPSVLKVASVQEGLHTQKT